MAFRESDRSRQAADVERGYRSEINNNLMEISDWLTKIIVGVGLIELGSLPEKLRPADRVGLKHATHTTILMLTVTVACFGLTLSA